MRRLARFMSLPRAQQSLLLQTLSLVVAMRVALWLLPFQAVQRLALRTRKKSKTSRPVQQLVWAVAAVSRCVPGARCLTQALAAQSLLARFGYASRLEIGVARDERRDFAAHAWLVCGEKVVIGGPAVDRYAPLTAWETKL